MSRTSPAMQEKKRAYNRHLSMLGLLTVPGLAGKTVPGNFFRRRQGLLLGHSGMK